MNSMMTTIDLTIQNVTQHRSVPTDAQFETWVESVLQHYDVNAEMTIRVVDTQESAELNERYRKKAGPTNVLSFLIDAGSDDTPLLGDVVICAPLVASEATEQAKPELAHWAHLTVHGCYHLLGYDHHTDAEATEMEALETQTLLALDFGDPYGDTDHDG